MSARKVIQELWEARDHQIKRGNTPTHDDTHTLDELLAAACAFMAGAVNKPAAVRLKTGKEVWPFEQAAFKPRSPRQDLVRAGAMIVAAIEHIDRNGFKP